MANVSQLNYVSLHAPACNSNAFVFHVPMQLLQLLTLALLWIRWYHLNYYYVETWTEGFVERIYLVSSVGGENVMGPAVGTTTELLPPAVRRPPGRPKKLRMISRGEFKVSNKMECHMIDINNLFHFCYLFSVGNSDNVILFVI